MLSKLLLYFFSIVVINNCCRNRDQLIVGYPTLKDTSATQLLPLKLREHHGRRGGKIVRARGPGSLLCLLRNNKEVTSIIYADTLNVI